MFRNAPVYIAAVGGIVLLVGLATFLVFVIERETIRARQPPTPVHVAMFEDYGQTCGEQRTPDQCYYICDTRAQNIAREIAQLTVHQQIVLTNICHAEAARIEADRVLGPIK